MAYNFHSMDTLQDESELLKRIIDLETQVRAKREIKRVSRNSENEQYSRIFDPITRQMKTLQAAVTTGSSEAGLIAKHML